MIHTLSSSQLAVQINSFGAELCSVKNTGGIEFIWQAQKETWPRHAPVLFPIVGKVKDNKYSLGGKSYELTQHGFARDKEFTLTSRSDSACTFSLKSDESTKQLFPYGFELQITYSLAENRLSTIYKVTNTSATDMYFSIGAHPGFNCPLEPNETFEDYYIEFEDDLPQVTLLEEGYRSNQQSELKLKDKRLYLSGTLFDHDALVFENNQIDAVTLASKKSGHKIKMENKGWPYFGIWSKKGCTKFVCLEPWHGITDPVKNEQDFTKKEGITKLGPKQEFNCEFSVSFV